MALLGLVPAGGGSLGSTAAPAPAPPMFTAKVGLAFCKWLPLPQTLVASLVVVPMLATQFPAFLSCGSTACTHFPRLFDTSLGACGPDTPAPCWQFSVFTAWLPPPILLHIPRVATSHTWSAFSPNMSTYILQGNPPKPGGKQALLPGASVPVAVARSPLPDPPCVSSNQPIFVRWHACVVVSLCLGALILPFALIGNVLMTRVDILLLRKARSFTSV